jgi:spermidine synthase
MKPWEVLARAPVPGGKGEFVLHHRDGEFVIRVNGLELMSSRVHGSEEELARRGCEGLRATPGARVLVGGLGLGYTLRATLDALGGDAEVTVAELAAAIVEWNQGPLAPLAGEPLKDGRVRVETADVKQVMRGGGPWDAILLDVDNGPSGLTQPSNAGLYGSAGLAAAHEALKPGGVLAVWSASPDERFTRRLEQAGFTAELHSSRAGRGRGTRHTLFLARRRRARRQGSTP